jgi:2-dehydro-3-deoxy-D-arabinonate dehydratase
MLIRFRDSSANDRLGLIQGSVVYDLSASGVPEFMSLAALLRHPAPLRVLRGFAANNGCVLPCAPDVLLPTGRDRGITLLPPIDAQEVWAAGVTYGQSEEARRQESEGAAAFYAKVYLAERPEIFFKATPHRTVGHTEPVMIRADAYWTVPEPELGVVLDRRLQTLGYVVGNDVSSRDIEGENPLYLPQAKIYMGSCALGPGIVLADEIEDPRALTLGMRIWREGAVVFEGVTPISAMRRSIPELTTYLGRANHFPDGVVLLTGTSIVPDQEFSLRARDDIEIWIDGIGTLRNRVEVAPSQTVPTAAVG